jgi:Immunity protein 74
MSWFRSRRNERPDELIELTRAKARLRVGQRLATVWGEGYAPGYGSPDFEAFRKQVEWDDGTPVTEGDRERILHVLEDAARARKLSLEIT